MNLYIAIRGEKRGKIFDLTEDGLEELVTRKTNGRETPAGYTGLIIPFSMMADEVIKFARRGEMVDEKIYEFKKH